MEKKLEYFRATLESAQRDGIVARGYDPEISGYRCRVRMGRKYACVDTGGPHWSGKYMVELTTGAIYGIKAYGVIHRGKRYGSLDTVDAFDWSGHSATIKTLKGECP